ncbi:MAG: T9SS type A sorting domain-containing protein, partial [Ferruginibacter sp.]
NTGINFVPTMNYATGLSKVTYTVTDLSGNVTICSFNVVVTDHTPPTLVCPGDQTLCKVVNNTYTIPQLVQSDNCVIVSTTYKITGVTSRTGSGTNASGTFNQGVSTITWTVKDVNNNTATCTTKVTVLPASNSYCAPAPLVDPGPGVVNPKFTEVEVPGLAITAWPNPSESYFNLRVQSPLKETVEIRMFDMAGKLVQTNRGAPGDTYTLGSTLVSGMYIIEVRQAGKTARTKVIKN